MTAQETLLGTYQVGAKTKVVYACKDFTADGKRFFDFCSIKNTILDSESDGSGTELLLNLGRGKFTEGTRSEFYPVPDCIGKC